MRLRLACLAAAALLLAAPEARACSCLAPPDGGIEAVIAEGAAILRGKVVGPAPQGWFGYPYYARIWVLRVRDGIGMAPPAEVRISTAQDSAACGIDLVPGTEVVLRVDGTPPDLWANLCGQVSLGAPDWDAVFAAHGVRP